MTELYLIRHAEAEGNVFRRLHGQYNSRITPNGLKQIAALQERFRDVNIDAVYASDLYRTCRTAQAIYVPKGLELHKEPRLRELNCGIWEDLPFGWLAMFDRERNRTFSFDPQNWSVEEGETFPVYTDRFLEALEEIARRHEGQTVAIFSHGMVMRGILQRLFFPEEKDLGHAENTAVTKLLWDGKATVTWRQRKSVVSGRSLRFMSWRTGSWTSWSSTRSGRSIRLSGGRSGRLLSRAWSFHSPGEKVRRK